MIALIAGRLYSNMSMIKSVSTCAFSLFCCVQVSNAALNATERQKQPVNRQVLPQQLDLPGNEESGMEKSGHPARYFTAWEGGGLSLEGVKGSRASQGALWGHLVTGL